MQYKLPKADQSGFSTLEMLLAMAILILTLTAVVLMTFGGQSLEVASQTNSEAINKAQALLEREQAQARKDFKLVGAILATDDIYSEKVEISPVIDPATGKTDYFSKLVTATVSWIGEHNQPLSTSLFTRVTNFNNAAGSETCDSALSPDADAWKNPQIIKAFGDLSGTNNFSSLTSIVDNYPITDIDAYNGRLYVTINNSSAATSTVPTFFVFNVDVPGAVAPITNDFVDNDPSVKSGLNAVAVAKDASTQKIYAYVAGAGSKQFQVIDVNSIPPVVIPTAGIDLGVDGFNGAGNSIFYKDGYVYVGLTKVGSGPQFAVIDVHDPVHPAFTGGAFTVGNDVNAIYVRNGYAYLAVPDTATHEKLIILNINNPASPTQAGGYGDADGNNGKSIYLIGDDLYLGKTINGTELKILDVGNPATTTMPESGSYPSIDESIDGAFVRSGMDTAIPPVFRRLAFLVTPSKLQILDVTDLAAISPWATRALDPSTINTISLEPSVDCEGNQFFVGSNDNGKNGFLTVIKP